MRRRLALVFAPLCLFSVCSGPALASSPLSAVEQKRLPAVDRARLLAEDAAVPRGEAPLRFAVAHPVLYTPATDGTWESTADGKLLWRLRVQSEGARNLNFGFTRYAMPPGGKLVIYTPDHSQVLGPYTDADNKPHGELWTPVLDGEEAVIELTVPPARLASLQLELTSVNHGYRAFPPTAEKDLGASGACNVDVICSQGDGWRDQISSVARMLIDGLAYCSGALINNTSQDDTPYFLTAFHCGVTSANDQTVVTYWNFDGTTCGVDNASDTMTFSSTTWRAGRPGTDFTLLEIDGNPGSSFSGYFAGWNRAASNHDFATAIHHPMGDQKKISFENDPTTTTSYLQTAEPGDGTHLRVADWDLGTTEGGSSGSPLFDPWQRIVGQLHGGDAACGNNLDDWYGRLSWSWGGAGPTTRLRDWLDPGVTGAEILDGKNFGVMPPVNDRWQDATPITPGTVMGTLVAATNDGSSSVGMPSPLQPEVWYSYTPPSSGSIRVNTCGTNDTGGLDQGMDTTVSVHPAGAAGTSANELDANDDWPTAPASDPTACQGSDTGSTRDSALSFAGTSGQGLLIRVSRYEIPSGPFTLTLVPEPGALLGALTALATHAALRVGRRRRG